MYILFTMLKTLSFIKWIIQLFVVYLQVFFFIYCLVHGYRKFFPGGGGPHGISMFAEGGSEAYFR